MRESGQNGRRKWPFALTVSAALHALAIVGLARAPGTRPTPPDETLAVVWSATIDDDNPSDGEINLAPRAELQTRPTAVAKVEGPPVSMVPDSTGNLAHPFQDVGSPSGTAGRNGSGDPGSGTGVKAVCFFGVSVSVRRVVYVIDGSGSMGKNGALAAARTELIRSLRALPPECRFQVIIYNSSARPLLPNRPGWLEPTASLVQEASAALLHLPAEGPTDHGQGLQAGLYLQPDALYFLTDADDLTKEHVHLALRFNPNNRTAIHTIELNGRHRDRPDMPMQLLPRLCGGSYQAVDLANFVSRR